jgi:hypothetical protein
MHTDSKKSEEKFHGQTIGGVFNLVMFGLATDCEKLYLLKSWLIKHLRVVSITRLIYR